MLPNRQALFNELLRSETLKKAIKEEAAAKKIPEARAREMAEEYLDEIAAHYSDSLVRIAERILTWLWNKLYKGINIKGAEQIRQLHHDGHEIVYVLATAVIWITCCSPIFSIFRVWFRPT